MNVRLSFLIALVSVCYTGCLRDPYLDTYLESLNSEKRYLEDQIYELQYEYEAKSQELESLRQENQRLRDNSIDGDGPQIEIPGGAGSTDDDSPNVDFGDPSDGQSDASGRPADVRSAVSSQVTPISSSADVKIYTPPLDLRVTHLVLNPYLSGGHDFDGKPGDDGVSLVIQPRNGDDQFVPVAGALSIVLLDPLVEGEMARVARWDLDMDEIRHRLRISGVRERGIHLKLPWTGGPPRHSHLHLFVRYTSDDDRKLETDGELVVALPGQFSNRWTPRPTERLDARPLQGQSEPNVSRQTTAGAADLSAPTAASGRENVAHARRRPVWRPFR